MEVKSKIIKNREKNIFWSTWLTFSVQDFDERKTQFSPFSFPLKYLMYRKKLNENLAPGDSKKMLPFNEEYKIPSLHPPLSSVYTVLTLKTIGRNSINFQFCDKRENEFYFFFWVFYFALVKHLENLKICRYLSPLGINLKRRVRFSWFAAESLLKDKNKTNLIMF